MHKLSTSEITQNANDRDGVASRLIDFERKMAGVTNNIATALHETLSAPVSDDELRTVRRLGAEAKIANAVEGMAHDAEELTSGARVKVVELGAATERNATQEPNAISMPFRCSHNDRCRLKAILLESLEVLKLLHAAMENETSLDIYGQDPMVACVGRVTSDLLQLRTDMNKCVDSELGRPTRRDERAAVVGAA